MAASGEWNVIVRHLRRGCDWLAVAWRLKVGRGRVEVSDSWCGVGKRLCNSWGMVESALVFRMTDTEITRRGA